MQPYKQSKIQTGASLPGHNLWNVIDNDLEIDHGRALVKNFINEYPHPDYRGVIIASRYRDEAHNNEIRVNASLKEIPDVVAHFHLLDNAKITNIFDTEEEKCYVVALAPMSDTIDRSTHYDWIDGKLIPNDEE